MELEEYECLILSVAFLSFCFFVYNVILIFLGSYIFEKSIDIFLL